MAGIVDRSEVDVIDTRRGEAIRESIETIRKASVVAVALVGIATNNDLCFCA